ncbi:MAG: VCBS repeat-containing protein, partial [Actinomycetota bacterium]|nr:VCBS repeat-containing protein [Actinomycetota bacterium]
VTLGPTAAPLVGVDRLGGAGAEVHVMDGATRYATFLSQSASALPAALEPHWTFRLADHDRDGVRDLFAVEHPSRSFVRVRVLSGASGYRSSLLDVVTPLRLTDQASWVFDVADLDGDGHLDLVGVDRQGQSGTEVHALSGSSGLRGWQVNTATALPRTATSAWSFSLGDHDRDGVPDLFAIARAGASGRTEVHVLSGAAGFRGWLAQVATPLGPTRPEDWSFDVGDADGNGEDDLVGVLRGGASGRTEVHVLDRTHARWQLHAVTPLRQTAGQANWSFDLVG